MLVQVAFHTQIAREKGEFDLAYMLTQINGKLVRRHPHVFGDETAADAREVKRNWEQIKQAERDQAGVEKSPVDGIPKDLPALTHAQLMQDRVGHAGFEWEEVSGVLDKLVEEVEELRRAASHEEKVQELGDVFFVLVNLARWLDIHAEDVLRQANRRFATRYRRMEELAAGQAWTSPDFHWRKRRPSGRKPRGWRRGEPSPSVPLPQGEGRSRGHREQGEGAWKRSGDFPLPHYSWSKSVSPLQDKLQPQGPGAFTPTAYPVGLRRRHGYPYPQRSRSRIRLSTGFGPPRCAGGAAPRSAEQPVRWSAPGPLPCTAPGYLSPRRWQRCHKAVARVQTPSLPSDWPPVPGCSYSPLCPSIPLGFRQTLGHVGQQSAVGVQLVQAGRQKPELIHVGQ